MITITPNAADQIRRSVEHSQAENMSLRIAVRKEDDGTFVYGMGFDTPRDDDSRSVSEGIDVLIASADRELLQGATLDFVEITPGEHNFIFINPNDPLHTSSSPSGNPP